MTSPIRWRARSLRALPCPPDRARHGRRRRAARRDRATSARAQPSERGGRRIRVGHGHDSCGRGGVEHAEVPVLAGRRPRLGVEDEVVVGELDRAGAPPCQRVADHDLELADRSLAVVAANPRVGGGVERVGVVGEVGRVDPRRRAPCLDGAVERIGVGIGRQRRRRSRRGRAGRGRRGRRHPRRRRRWFPCGGHSGAWRQKSRRSSGAPARSSSRSTSTHSTPRLSANTRACGLMRVATKSPRVGVRLGSRSSRSW